VGQVEPGHGFKVIRSSVQREETLRRVCVCERKRERERDSSNWTELTPSSRVHGEGGGFPPSEVLPLFIESHCKVTLRTKVLHKAAHALRLGRCVLVAFPAQLPGSWGSSCTHSIRAGQLLLACWPHVAHLGSPHHAWDHLLLTTLGARPPQQAHVTSSFVSISRWAQLSWPISRALIIPQRLSGDVGSAEATKMWNDALRAKTVRELFSSVRLPLTWRIWCLNFQP
jgi:hypothetical protein